MVNLLNVRLLMNVQAKVLSVKPYCAHLTFQCTKDAQKTNWAHLEDGTTQSANVCDYVKLAKCT